MESKPNTSVALKLNTVISNVLTQVQLNGFERAYATANAITELKELLTPEYMKPIMALQGNKLGFRTDKDKNGGYPLEVVKNCLIEAVLQGVQPYGNQFNIIAGNCYLTKEGIGHILNNWQGLKYTIICGVPEVKPDGKSAVVEAKINWTINNTTSEEKIPISVKNDQYSSVDSLIGKATRKARAWLLSAISGIEVVEGDIEDISYTEVRHNQPANTKEVSEDKQRARVIEHINIVKDLTGLARCKPAIKDDDTELRAKYYEKERTLALEHIKNSTSLEMLNKCSHAVNPEDEELFLAYDDKKRELTKSQA